MTTGQIIGWIIVAVLSLNIGFVMGASWCANFKGEKK